MLELLPDDDMLVRYVEERPCTATPVLLRRNGGVVGAAWFGGSIEIDRGSASSMTPPPRCQ